MKAKDCDNSVTKFCEFYASFCSIVDLSLINPDYPNVIVKPMGFKSFGQISKLHLSKV